MQARRLTVAVASGAIAIGAAGLLAAYPAFAADPLTSVVGSGPVARADGTGPADRIQEALKSLVDDGTITQDQADKVAGKLTEALPGQDLGQEPGQGPGQRLGHGPDRVAGGLGVALDEVATALGMSRDDVESALADGKTVKDLAEEQGKDVDDVIDALVAAATARIDQAVADGDLDQDRADDIKAGLKRRITWLVEHGAPRFRGHGERSRA